MKQPVTSCLFRHYFIRFTLTTNELVLRERRRNQTHSVLLIHRLSGGNRLHSTYLISLKLAGVMFNHRNGKLVAI